MSTSSALTFWGLVRERAEAHPDRPMLCDDRGRTLTLGEFHEAAERAAAGFFDLGVRESSVVSWQLPTTLESFVLMAALARLGAVQNPIVPILRDRDVGYITAAVGSDLLVVPGEWRGFDYTAMARGVAEGGVGFGVVEIDCSGTSQLGLPGGAGALPDPSSPSAQADDPVRWIYFSSGTTAEPKGIRHSDRSVMHSANGLVECLGVGPDDLYPIAFPVAHIGGMAVLCLSLRTGCRLGCIESFDPERAPRAMAAMGATVLGSALPFLNAYVDAQRANGPTPLFPRLRQCVSGGAPKPAGLHARVRDVLGGAGVISSWGLTEFPIATHARPDDSDETLDATEGRPVSGVELRVVAADGAVVGPGHEGELRLKGPQLFRGYVDPELDQDAFDEDGWLRTGDLGIVDATGSVRITGRSKDVIIRNAENISAKEVEDLLVRHSSVSDVAIIGIPDPRTGERVCAVVVPTTDQPTPTLAELAAFCRTQGLARQKSPERLEVVDVLPRNAMGKVLKNVLRARYTEPHTPDSA